MIVLPLVTSSTAASMAALECAEGMLRLLLDSDWVDIPASLIQVPSL